MTGYLTAMKRYATFRGRATRAEFWGFTAVMVVIEIVAFILDVAVISGPDSQTYVFARLVVLAHALPSLAVSVRRLHDTDRSGWFVLLNLIPLVGFVLLLVWFCQPGTHSSNQFGPDPLDGEAALLPGRVPASPAVLAGAGAAPAARDVVGELERLATLHSQGRLSDAEFSALKARALSTGDVA